MTTSPPPAPPGKATPPPPSDPIGQPQDPIDTPPPPPAKATPPPPSDPITQPQDPIDTPPPPPSKKTNVKEDGKVSKDKIEGSKGKSKVTEMQSDPLPTTAADSTTAATPPVAQLSRREIEFNVKYRRGSGSVVKDSGAASEPLGTQLSNRLAVEFNVEVGRIRIKYSNTRREEQAVPATAGPNGGNESLDDSSVIIVITGASEAEIKSFADKASRGSLDNVFEEAGLTIVNFTVRMEPSIPTDWAIIFSWAPICGILLFVALLVFWRRGRRAAKRVPIVVSAAVADVKSDLVFMDPAAVPVPALVPLSPVELRSSLSIPDLQVSGSNRSTGTGVAEPPPAALIRAVPKLPRSPMAGKSPCCSPRKQTSFSVPQ